MRGFTVWEEELHARIWSVDFLSRVNGVHAFDKNYSRL